MGFTIAINNDIKEFKGIGKCKIANQIYDLNYV